MGVYVVTGSSSGMGKEVVARLEAVGHRVITVDVGTAEVVADLSTAEGRLAAADAVLERCGGRLDGAVLAAGLGPSCGSDRARLITQVNYFGVVELLTAWRPALAASGSSKAVVFASNSATTVPMVPRRAIRALLAGDEEAAVAPFRRIGKAGPALAYAASKVALARWVRRTAVTPRWAGAGIRLNAIAPGAVLTPLLEQQLATPSEARQLRSFPVPIGGYGDPGHLADWVLMMLSPAADFLCGSVIYVDGGSDAWFRADAWPAPVRRRDTLRYLRRMKEFRTQRRRP